MARMTKRLQPNNVIVYKFGKYEDTIAAEMETSDVRTVLKALADYEDLEEQCIADNQCGIRELLLKWKEFFDDIVALYDYRKAEEQGLRLRLPFLPKPGMKIYDIYGCIENGESEPREITIRSFDITHARMWLFHINNEVFTFDDFGKTYFLTREEAESALAEKGE